MQRARQAAFEGDLDTARELLDAVLHDHARDPLAPLASILLARVHIAHGDVADAVRVLEAARTGGDPVLVRKAAVVRGVLAARAGRHAETLSLLRSLDGQLPDRAETGELACALAESETHAGDPARALRALAVIESLSSEGASWLPTGLACEQVDTRAQLLRTVLEHVDDPQTLANTVDMLPADSPMRRPVEVRLHAIAERTHEVGRFIRWLGDLPDDTDVNSGAGAASVRPTLVVGIMAPGQGARASLGVSVLRGVQMALEGIDDVRSVHEDEGESPEAAVAALDRLYAQGTRVVVGVLHEGRSAAVAIRAQALGIDAWLLAPTHGVAGTGARVHLAGPSSDARAEAVQRVVGIVRGNEATRIALLSERPPTEVRDAVARELGTRGAAWTAVDIEEITARGAASAINVVLGTYGREARAAFARGAANAPGRWIFEARAAAPESAGVWIGLAAGPAFTAFLSEYCMRMGEPPEELTMLAYDAARRGVAHARNQTNEPATLLALDRAMVHAWIDARGDIVRASEGGAPAAVVRCPR